MDITSFVLFLLAGGLAGMLAVFFGVDVGIILVPVFLFLYRTIDVSTLVSTHLALGTSLLAVIFGSQVTSIRLSQSGHVVWKAVMFVGVAGVVGAVIGSVVAGELSGKTLQAMFALVLVVVALRLLFETTKPRNDAPPRVVAPALSGAGLATGLVASLTSTGRDVVLTPMLYKTMMFPLKKATGTSSVAVMVITLAAVVGFAVRGLGHAFLPEGTVGFVDYVHAIPVVVGLIGGSLAGDAVAQATRPAMFKKWFAVVLIVVAAGMLLL